MEPEKMKKEHFRLASGHTHIVYDPEEILSPPNYFHPILGYPSCPLIGRYNKGEYRIGEVVLHLEFKCSFIDGVYFCGEKALKLPDMVVLWLREIPEVIECNKTKGMKN